MYAVGGIPPLPGLIKSHAIPLLHKDTAKTRAFQQLFVLFKPWNIHCFSILRFGNVNSNSV